MTMKLFTFSSFIMLILISALSCSNGQEKKQNSSQKETIPAENIKVVEFDVDGMTCTGCEKTIEGGVKALDGIQEVQADHKAGRTVVKFDKTALTKAEISKVINGSGYTVTAHTPKQ